MCPGSKHVQHMCGGTHPWYSVPCSSARNSPTGSAREPKCSDMMVLRTHPRNRCIRGWNM